MNTQISFHEELAVLMKKTASISKFDAAKVIKELKHYLPDQAPLKDFVHHNTLHAFQNLKFFDALQTASTIFGYKSTLSVEEYRALYKAGRIREDVLQKVIIDNKGKDQLEEWKTALLNKTYKECESPRIGVLRSYWKKQYQMDMDSLVHPTLFRIVCSYLDQGISIWNFPLWENGFLGSILEMEKNSFTSFFKTKRAKQLLLENKCQLDHLLKIVVGDESLYEQYIFDQQFAHQGWSGIVSVIEDRPHTLVDPKKISLEDFIAFELLLEIDALEDKIGTQWTPLCQRMTSKPTALFAKRQKTELDEVKALFQVAFEWSYYDQVLLSLKSQKFADNEVESKNFQAIFCIDDRETSLRDYLEKTDLHCETFSTPGFFSVEFFFQPEDGKFYTKQCPAPVTPKYLIKEKGTKERAEKKDLYFGKNTLSLFAGMVMSPALGLWSVVKLAVSIFRPTITPAAASSFRHMHRDSQLTIENVDSEKENGLQVGFTVDEMTLRVEGLLKSIGLVKDFAPIIYVVGHGASSVNNPHYSAYDCGACSGRPGSVNAKVFSFMANHPKVRENLRLRDLFIPDETQFIGGLHDTTRDDVVFYEEQTLSLANKKRHLRNQSVFSTALDLNAKERSRRFESIDTKQSPRKIHQAIQRRAVSLFEPRPELNHATNALTIVGKREVSKQLFLDRRAFLNSYDYRIDPEGKYLLNILKAAAPVCGGINLEYFFSRVDNHKLGAGTKLPHNVMGLFGVANGTEGDLRPGLPSQMIEAHDPVRQLFIVEHFPEVVLKTIQIIPETYEWFINNWIHLVVIHPETKELYLFKEGEFTHYEPLASSIFTAKDMTKPIEASHSLENLPIYLIA